ncbi:pyrimidine 5'-nucleotidase [Sneathiella limimaris]|uniref:pyrimidine 5'-nucleotidase n=1 Tax=Sneathiella limimaris TaxID=1964213 RepID=UPI00146F8E88|nr:pyrimidine 5'-nucleotidase [Sneathiella limimaris]
MQNQKPSWTHFEDIDAWIFDLDNTLYPADCDLFSQMSVKMGEFVSNFLQVDLEEARRIQKHYFSEYGTTLNGLMKCNGVTPSDYLAYVHDIDISHIEPDTRLSNALDALEGRKIIFTNASEAHALNVASQLGIDHHFDAIYDIHWAEFTPKPAISIYEKMLADLKIPANRSVFFEDMAKNLKPAHDLGMKTVWIPNNAHWSHEDSGGDHIHHIADNLSEWLHHLVEDRQSRLSGS